ncbi:MAG: type II toxin-antitoxin system mRNA interferase toxin, RelE/StbE family [Nitrospirae bacterium]|nr:MAG: type II toxin-antitoxin system mRNA interferase toxin, RelE/StbE family [Nitrospirota bacterium]
MSDPRNSRDLRIRWERRAVKGLLALPPTDRRRVVAAVEGLRADPLQGEQLHAEWKGLRRLRVGRYLVIYGYDGRELLVTVVRVVHRREVYRRR